MVMKGAKDLRFGDVAVKKGFATSADIDRALNVQKLVYQRSRKYVFIGRVLIKMDVMTQKQLEEVLAIQKQIGQRFSSAAPIQPVVSPSVSDKKTTLKSTEALKEEDPQPVDESKIILKVSENTMFAYVLPVGEDFSGVTLDHIHALIEKNGISFGLVSDNILKRLLASDMTQKKPFLIAKGKSPTKGRPTVINYFFDVDYLKIGNLQEDGTMNWKERGELPFVKSGDLVAERIPGKEGTSGVDVFNEVIAPPEFIDLQLKSESGVKISKDGLKAFATIDGMPKILADGQLSVFPTFKVSGDVGLETGHIDFDGHVEVSGAIQTGYRARAKSLRAGELNGAEVYITEDIAVTGGIYSSVVRGLGSLDVSHVNDSSIDILGDLFVKKEIIDSKIEINGKCIIGNGRIIASEISAKKGIDTRDIGKEGAHSSTLTVGIDHKLQRDIGALKKKISVKKEQIKNSEAMIPELKEHISQLETTLGEVAQEQDKHMVQQRDLQEKLKKLGNNIDEAAKEKVNNGINMLTLKIGELDENVANILDEEDKTEEKISKLEQEIKSLQLETENLNEEISQLTESMEMDRGIPIVQVNGEAIPDISFVFPHCRGVIRKPLRRIKITETNKNDAKRWQSRITPM